MTQFCIFLLHINTLTFNVDIWRNKVKLKHITSMEKKLQAVQTLF